MSVLEQSVLEQIAFIGNTLSPLFLYDPLAKETADLYEALRQVDVHTAAADWPFGNTLAIEHGLHLMQVGINAGREELSCEFQRLFVGPETKAVPPWGSVYTDHDRILFGETALDLHDWMSKNTIRATVDDHMPDDHVGRMLALLAWIAQQRPSLLEEYLQDHFLTWIPHFLSVLDDRTRSDFYHGLSVLTQESIEGIGQALSVQVVEPRFFR